MVHAVGKVLGSEGPTGHPIALGPTVTLAWPFVIGAFMTATSYEAILWVRDRLREEEAEKRANNSEPAGARLANVESEDAHLAELESDDVQEGTGALRVFLIIVGTSVALGAFPWVEFYQGHGNPFATDIPLIGAVMTSVLGGLWAGLIGLCLAVPTGLIIAFVGRKPRD